ncbi:hypothetical protein [Spiroplasma endosymbiont of Diplazon laetatorius]|uniref:hypothetical protein n=1 Tax=Spiroplasma endosymbiont of Diplazon laetatorius TaxID=3066322 RepID=UPI0030CA9DDE
MKKMLTVWLSLGLTVSAGVGSTLKNESKNTNKYSRYLTSMDDFLYLKTDVGLDIKELDEKHIEKALRDSFNSDKLGKEVFENVDYEVISSDNGELTVLFKDKKGMNLLKEKIILKFNMVLFNYDKIKEFVYVMDNYIVTNPLILNKNKYLQIEIEDLLKFKFKNLFDRYAASVLYLDNIKEFWEFVDLEDISNQKNETIKAKFLNDSRLNFKILRSSESFGNDEFDKYINFSVNENIFKKEIFNWIKKYAFFNGDLKDYNNLFEIEFKDEKTVTISLSDKLFTNSKLITLNKIK